MNLKVGRAAPCAPGATQPRAAQRSDAPYQPSRFVLRMPGVLPWGSPYAGSDFFCGVNFGVVTGQSRREERGIYAASPSNPSSTSKYLARPATTGVEAA